MSVTLSSALVERSAPRRDPTSVPHEVQKGLLQPRVTQVSRVGGTSARIGSLSGLRRPHLPLEHDDLEARVDVDGIASGAGVVAAS